MASDQLPINAQVLVWARKRAGFSIAELSKGFKKLEAWEKGSESPTYPQLEELSDKLKLPIAVFFFPDPPESEPLSESFRTLSASQIESMPRRVGYLLRKAKAMQLNLKELVGPGNPASKQIVHDISFDSDSELTSIVTIVRDYLGVQVEDQLKWSDPDEALKHWRTALADTGVFVFKDAFKADGYFGFCLYDDEFPLIYVNNTSTKTRQIFTLFHELSHLLFGTSGFDPIGGNLSSELDPSAARIESFCNQFASHFLVPEDKFEELRENREPSQTTAAFLADKFCVSREVVFRRFLDKGLIQPSEYSAAVEKWKSQIKKKPGGDYYNNQIAYLGTRYINLALQQFHQNRIDQIQLAEYLNITPKNVEKFEERFIGRAG